MRRFLFAVLCVLPLAVSRGRAAPLLKEDVPGPLQPWVSWALKGQEQALCPFFQGQDRRDCVWPGTLRLTLDEGSGRFEQTWRLYAESWVFLPGGSERWPQEVKVGGATAQVLRRGDAPALRLKAGTHSVTGSWKWARLPEQLQVPGETGLLSLSMRGSAVPFPARDEAGRLWLQPSAGQAPPKEESHLEVAVHRKLSDDAPLQLTTRVQLKVSGAGREAALGRALPDGFIPMSLVSPLPARLDPDGRLRVQARAGTWELVIVSRQETPGREIRLPEAGGTWDAQEVWVFEARPDLRQADLQGAPSLDPNQTELPGQWRVLPAFLVEPKSALKLVERRRGDDPPSPDRLSLKRELWLDFDGGGFSARDTLSGTLGRSWRLEASPETHLGRVSIGGEDQYLTSLSSGGPAGLEVRSRAVSITADSRVEGRALPATGWRHDFESVSAALHLPPGWRLLHAGGVDQATPTWVSTWTLLDLFLVLVAAAAFGRLWGPRWGAAALAGIGLAWHEPDAPRWVWLLALMAAALDRALSGPETMTAWTGRFKKMAWALLALVCAPFFISQARVALYPVLEFPYTSVQPRDAGQVETLAAPQSEAPEDAYDMAEQSVLPKGAGAGGSLAPPMLSMVSGAASSMGGRSYRLAKPVRAAKAYQMRLDPNARVTTGPGLPYWTWRQVNLAWKGPVGAGHTVNLWLLPPAGSFVLAVLRISLIAVLALLLWGFPVGEWLDGLRGPEGRRRAMGALLPLAFFLLACAPARAQSAFPPRELLDELRNRLLEKPDCFPLCAESPRLRLEATGSWLSLRLDVHAAAATAVPVPSGGRAWSPARAMLGGSPAEIRRGEDGTLWVAIPPGTRELTLEGPLPAADSVQIALPLKPRRVEASVSGWTLHGLREDGKTEDNLQLSRARGSEPAAAAAAQAQGLFPPFLLVERTVRLGLSWSVETKVTRLTPTGTPVVAAIPLLSGEAVTSAEPRVEGGKAQVSLGPQVQTTSWVSVLKETESLELSAAKTGTWAESWRIEPGPLWNLKASGLPPIHEDPNPGARTLAFRPWPGETLTLALWRPAAIAGQTLTVDQTILSLSPGLRATDATLTLSLRSSRGGPHTLVLPDGADLLSVKVDGALQPLRMEGRKLTVPVQPGAHAVEAAWRQDGGAGLLFRGPAVDAGASGVNAHVQVSMPRRSWILLAGGPGMGPAVLFWSVLAVFLLLSVGLGKTGLAPLTWKHWFLLSLGLTQIGVFSAALIAAWFLAMGWRAARPPQGQREFRLAQVFLAFLTLLAAAALFSSIKRGLLGLPEMQIAGNGSSAELLRWYADRAASELPRPWVFSVPLWVYRLAMLSWALWLAESMIVWTRWAWRSYTTEGLWK